MIVIHIDPPDKKVRVRVEARDDGRLIHEDRFNASNSISRKRFAKDVANKINSPESAGDIEQSVVTKLDDLRRMVAEATEQERKQKSVAVAKPPPKPLDDETILDPKAPLDAAREFLEAFYAHGDGRRLLYVAGCYHLWNGVHYEVHEEQGIRSKVYAWLDHAKVWKSDLKSGDKELAAFKPNSRLVSDVLDALRGLCHASATAPCWIAGESGLPDPKRLLLAPNGIFDLSAGLDVPPMKLTPNLYSLNAMQFAVNPKATAPMAWLDFLASVWGDDRQSIELLQEWFGYCLTQDNTQQKIMLVVGPPRSGKGTITDALTHLVGESNMSSPTLNTIGSTFGLMGLLGKQLAIINDARLSGKADQAIVIERLLTISGKGALDVERKNLPPVTTKLATRFLITTNEMPRLTDASGALTSRFLILTMRNSFLGREDLDLGDRLRHELPGILLWAAAGLERLIDRGRFVQPASAEDAIIELEELTSPVKSFIKECCDVRPSAWISCQSLFEHWGRWCKSQGRDHAGNIASFGRDLRAAFPSLKTTQPRSDDNSRVRGYDGIGLKEGLLPFD